MNTIVEKILKKLERCESFTAMYPVEQWHVLGIPIAIQETINRIDVNSDASLVTLLDAVIHANEQFEKWVDNEWCAISYHDPRYIKIRRVAKLQKLCDHHIDILRCSNVVTEFLMLSLVTQFGSRMQNLWQENLLTISNVLLLEPELIFGY